MALAQVYFLDTDGLDEKECQQIYRILGVREPICQPELSPLHFINEACPNPKETFHDETQTSVAVCSPYGINSSQVPPSIITQDQNMNMRPPAITHMMPLAMHPVMVTSHLPSGRVSMVPVPGIPALPGMAVPHMPPHATFLPPGVHSDPSDYFRAQPPPHMSRMNPHVQEFVPGREYIVNPSVPKSMQEMVSIPPPLLPPQHHVSHQVPFVPSNYAELPVHMNGTISLSSFTASIPVVSSIAPPPQVPPMDLSVTDSSLSFGSVDPHAFHSSVGQRGSGDCGFHPGQILPEILSPTIQSTGQITCDMEVVHPEPLAQEVIISASGPHVHPQLAKVGYDTVVDISSTTTHFFKSSQCEVNQQVNKPLIFKDEDSTSHKNWSSCSSVNASQNITSNQACGSSSQSYTEWHAPGIGPGEKKEKSEDSTHTSSLIVNQEQTIVSSNVATAQTPSMPDQTEPVAFVDKTVLSDAKTNSVINNAPVTTTPSETTLQPLQVTRQLSQEKPRPAVQSHLTDSPKGYPALGSGRARSVPVQGSITPSGVKQSVNGISEDKPLNDEVLSGMDKSPGCNLASSLPNQDHSTPPVTTVKMSWANLFRSPSSQGSSPVVIYKDDVDKSMHSVVPNQITTPIPSAPTEVVSVDNDTVASELGEHLSKLALIHSSVPLQPRGLLNRGNWCYVNATLQALVACPPFYHLFRKLAELPLLTRGASSTPILDSIVRFVSEFHKYDRQGNIKRGKQIELLPGPTFEPDYVYKMLQVIKASPSFKHGHQEDAEEFLSCILDGLHEEMLAALRHAAGGENGTSQTNGYVGTGEFSPNNSQEASDAELEDEDWQEVGPKNKSVHTRKTSIIANTPIAKIFAGSIRSGLTQAQTKERATLQPFFTLQLDIQEEKIASVKDALDHFVSKESIQGYTCSKTGEEVEISKRTTLEELPPVLILHLKCFVYDQTGGCQKLMKNIKFDVDLQITKDLLSSSAKSKLQQVHRTYKLFAVVFHHGKKATGGHYTTDVFHPGTNGWVHMDDSRIIQVHETEVLSYCPPKMPYLLYYRRRDLTSPGS